jgi:hypothetical protein
VSKASWAPFVSELTALLTHRRVPREAAVVIASEIRDVCGDFLSARRFAGPEYDFQSPAETVLKLRKFLRAVAMRSIELRKLLQTSPQFKWSDTELVAKLDQTASSARAAEQRLGRRGRTPDWHRHHLEDAVARILRQHSVRITTARSGTFALLLEQVHSAAGISERDVHKSVRRAIDGARMRV